MKKSIALVLTFVLAVTMLAGCTGTTVVIGECTCPADSHQSAPEVQPETPEVPEAPGAEANRRIFYHKRNEKSTPRQKKKKERQ